MYMLTADS